MTAWRSASPLVEIAHQRQTDPLRSTRDVRVSSPTAATDEGARVTGRLTLTWANKDRALLSDDAAGYP